jgi:Mor family transcriptional regulator
MDDIIAAIGADAASVLCSKLGGTMIYVPLRIKNVNRNSTILHDRLLGMTINMLARKYQLSKSRIQAILQKPIAGKK